MRKEKIKRGAFLAACLMLLLTAGCGSEKNRDENVTAGSGKDTGRSTEESTGNSTEESTGKSTEENTGKSTEKDTEEDDGKGYKSISQEKAKEMMKRDDGHIILDVRRKDEYDQGHIPGAILVPNEYIFENQQPKALPDLSQIILVYCRSGRRSKEAAEKLAKTGYTNIYEFGGIIDWTGEIVVEDGKKKKEETKLTFDSFDGGGPDYTVVLEDDSIVSYNKEKTYGNPDHAEMEGSSFDITFTFRGQKAGHTKMTIEERSPIAGNRDHLYQVTVDDNLDVSLEELSVRDLGE